MPINQRVLVVDDDAVFAEAIGSVLCQAGFKVDIATHFVPALKILEDADAIDLLIIDLVMPSGINGIALSRMASMRRPGLRIVYVTGHDIPGAEREAVGEVREKMRQIAAHLIERGRRGACNRHVAFAFTVCVGLRATSGLVVIRFGTVLLMTGRIIG